MDLFINYLDESKQLSKNINCCNTLPVHVIMGNESCDLDSMISTLALAYLHKHTSTEPTVFIPIMNITEEEFTLRTENCYVLNKFGINKNVLVFRNNLNLKEIQQHGLLSVSLVDHHVVKPEDEFLIKNVTEIFDHRPIDPKANWVGKKTSIRIEEVGSCATLITQKIFSEGDGVLNTTLASLLYYTIIFDTIALSLEAGKTKELDLSITEQLKNDYSINSEPKLIFDELWSAHNDVSHLTTYQLLFKDLKIVDGLPMPGLPMLVKDYLKLANAMKDMKKFCQEKACLTMIVIGLNVEDREGTKEVFRDLAIFTLGNDQIFVDHLILSLMTAPDLKGYDFCLMEEIVDNEGVRYFKQNNIQLTRKHLLPIIKHVVLKFK